MTSKMPLRRDRIRKITGSFAFLEHRFLRDGFWKALSHDELVLYIFLILVGDRNGVSWYGYEKICALLRFSGQQYLDARDGLIDKDLIAFDRAIFQVLSLPCRVAQSDKARARGSGEQHSPLPVGQILALMLEKTTEKP